MAKKPITKKRSVKSNKKNISLGLMVSDRVQLRDVRLISCDSFQKPNAPGAKKKFAINYSTQIETNEQSKHIVVVPKFHFEAFREDNDGEPVVVINASFALLYKLETFDGLTKENFKQFADANGIYNAWPYWREFVQNIVARMGLPPLAIPVFRLVETPRSGDSEKEAMPEKKAAKKETV